MKRWWWLALLLIGACATAPKTSLYDQLGSQDGVSALAQAIIDETQADPRISALFAETETDYFRDRLVEQICMLAGGPCEYTGLSMPDAHSGMDISEREFNWFVEDVERAMDKVGLPLSTQNQLLALLARMRPEVIRQ